MFGFAGYSCLTFQRKIKATWGRGEKGRRDCFRSSSSFTLWTRWRQKEGRREVSSSVFNIIGQFKHRLIRKAVINMI